jgi:cell division protein FtsL
MKLNSKRIVRGVIVLVCLYLVITTIQAINDLWRAGDKLTNREMELKQVKKENERLLLEKRRIKSDDYLEKIARDDLGMSRRGERVVLIPEELLADNSQRVEKEDVPNWKQWRKVLLGF